jgi:hypothetical protein
MPELDTLFVVVFILLLAALSISNFVEYRSKGQNQVGQAFFALLYMCGAIALTVYKIKNP